MSETTILHEVTGRSIPWHELSPNDLRDATRIAHRATNMLKAIMSERQIPLLPHAQVPDTRMLAMDVCVLRLSRRDVDLQRFANSGADDFMSDVIALMTHINRVDGVIFPDVHFRCANVAR